MQKTIVTHFYSFGGLRVRSDIKLVGLVPAGESEFGWAGQLDLRVETGAAVAHDVVSYEWHNGYRMRIGETDGRWLIRSRFDGSFLIDRDGRAMTLVVATMPPDPATIEVLLRRVLTRVPMLQGAIAVHAASLVQDGGGIMLIGRSGAGKSTLCAALTVQSGWQTLGDDTALLWEPQAPMLGAGAKNVCLWPDSRDGLKLSVDESTPLASATGKGRSPIEASDPPPLVPLRALVFLDRRADVAEPRLERLEIAEAMSLILHQIIHFNPSGTSAQERVHAVSGLREVLQRRPTWRLVYPSDYAALPQVEARLRQLLANGPVAPAPQSANAG
ncbi:hypothetical protein K9B35_00295 [Sphingomonas sp. R647]|uniref:hypothetical protein n=1 Tax=Sphingomonas sp. R647 TaxID=2875233 RepID=UPI001CD5C374|nr:hypothetical protein [Sphingomonas sp. R647]MCA1196394.1 hypothetical protein [Sphingomonas sp. R647]